MSQELTDNDTDGDQPPSPQWRSARLTDACRLTAADCEASAQSHPDQSPATKEKWPHGNARVAAPAAAIKEARNGSNATVKVTSAEERRRFPRRPSIGTVRAVRKSQANNRSLNPLWALRSASACGRLIDVSMLAVACNLSEQFRVGDELLIEVKRQHRDFALVCSARVVECEAEADGEYRIVCKFATRLGFDEIAQLGRPL